MTGESSDAGLRKPGETTVTGLWVPICATRHAVISIVVPTYQEAENLPHVTKAVADAFSDRASSYEILFVDDEDSLVEVGVEMLKGLGYDAVGTNRAAQALDPDEPMLLYNLGCIYAMAGERADARDEADGRHGDPTGPEPETRVKGGQGAEHLLQVGQRLAHAHQHHVRDFTHAVALVPQYSRSLPDLADDFTGGQVAVETLRASGAERAVEGAADLRGNAQRAAALFRYMHHLDSLTAAGVESLFRKQVRYDTPHLAIRYQPAKESTFWRT